MHRHAWLAVAAVLLFSNIVASPAFAETRVALVIGNGAYAHAPHLLNPSHDAEDVSAALKRTGFQTIVGLDLDQAGMQDAAIRFARAARNADVAVFYYSGHAMQYAGVNYLVPIDAQLRDEADLRRMARVDEILSDLQQARNLRILVLDSCRDNPLADELRRSIGRTRGVSIGRGLAKMESPNGTIISYATQSGSTSLDGDGRNSPYTSAFLKHIEDKDEVSTVFHRISAKVYEATRGEQTPELSLSFFGEFYLNGKLQVTVTPPVPVDPCAAASDHWRSAEAIGTVDAFQDHLTRFPGCAFAGLAKARIEVLKSKIAVAPPPVSPAAPVLPPPAPAPAPAPPARTEVAILTPEPPKPSPGTATAERRYTLPAGAELEPLLPGRGNCLYSIDFSPQGDRIVGWDGCSDKVIMWDIVKGKLLWSATDENEGVGFVAFSPDGTRVASGGHGDNIRIRDAASGAILLSIEPKDTNIEYVVFSPNGQWLAAADNDEKVELWNTTTGKLIRTLGGRYGCYCYATIGLSADGAQIVSGYPDKSIKVWDTATGRVLRTFKAKSSQAWDTAFSPNGAQIVSGQDDKTIKVWEKATGRMLSSFAAHSGVVAHVAFSPDGARIASTDRAWKESETADKIVKLWDTSGKLLMSLGGNKSEISSIRFSPQGSRIASGNDEGVKLWDVETGALLATFVTREDGHGVAYTPDGLFVTDIESGAALKVVQNGKELPSNELVALNRRDSLANVLKITTATK